MTTEEGFSFPVSVKDYRLWTKALMPVFLILFDALLEEAYWLDIQEDEHTHDPNLTGDTVNVHIPRSHVLGFQTIRMMRQRKNARVERLHTTLKRKNNNE